MEHVPVLLNEVLEQLRPESGGVFIDCTLGHAGHAKALAQRLGKNGLLVGLDADPRNLENAAAKLKASEGSPTRLFHANFAELREVMGQIGITKVSGILADLGVSTNQLFDAEYGLSFDRPSKLDMRLDPRLEMSAADLVNKLPETKIADLLFHLAQERASRKIARKIVEARRIQPILTTDRLAGIVRAVVPPGHGQTIDPATRTFLALRMAVNREQENLATLLEYAPTLLAPGGRLAIISFQSTEDRAVKEAFARLKQAGKATVLTTRPLRPSDAEIAANPRSRSAKLRVLEVK